MITHKIYKKLNKDLQPEVDKMPEIIENQSDKDLMEVVDTIIEPLERRPSTKSN